MLLKFLALSSSLLFNKKEAMRTVAQFENQRAEYWGLSPSRKNKTDAPAASRRGPKETVNISGMFPLMDVNVIWRAAY